MILSFAIFILAIPGFFMRSIKAAPMNHHDHNQFQWPNELGAIFNSGQSSRTEHGHEPRNSFASMNFNPILQGQEDGQHPIAGETHPSSYPFEAQLPLLHVPLSSYRHHHHDPFNIPLVNDATQWYHETNNDNQPMQGQNMPQQDYQNVGHHQPAYYPLEHQNPPMYMPPMPGHTHENLHMTSSQDIFGQHLQDMHSVGDVSLNLDNINYDMLKDFDPFNENQDSHSKLTLEHQEEGESSSRKEGIGKGKEHHSRWSKGDGTWKRHCPGRSAEVMSILKKETGRIDSQLSKVLTTKGTFQIIDDILSHDSDRLKRAIKSLGLNLPKRTPGRRYSFLEGNFAKFATEQYAFKYRIQEQTAAKHLNEHLDQKAADLIMHPSTFWQGLELVHSRRSQIHPINMSSRPSNQAPSVGNLENMDGRVHDGHVGQHYPAFPYNEDEQYGSASQAGGSGYGYY